MSLTTDGNDPGLEKIKPNGQQESYLVLSEEERAKGFVRKVRDSYVHMGNKIEGKIRLLTTGELEQYSKYGYYAFMEFDESQLPLTGRYLSKSDYDSIKDGYYGGCGTLTTMGRELAETYARDPKFYGGTFCCGCGKHLPVHEFVWSGTNELVGS